MLRARPGGAGLPIMLLLILFTPVPTEAGGEQYWSYSYRNVDVMAEGTSAYAVNLARYCVRLDAMLTRILGIKTSYRVPTHIYALPGSQLSQFIGLNGGVSSRASGYDNIIIADSAAARDSDYWSAYFGYTATLLASDNRLRGPDWYMHGVPSVFADTSYKGNRATLGNVTRGYALTLGRSALIPMRSFLTMKYDPAAHDHELYEAQAWALAHEVYVEGWRRAEFVKYLDLMRAGTSEAAAFAASFEMSYEELDKQFAAAIARHAYAYTLDSPDDAAAAETARQLDATEVKGRLALLAVRYGKGPDAVQLANEALQGDPNNQTALEALALAQLKRGAYGESLAAIDKLVADGPADSAYPDIAFVLGQLSRVVASGQATLPVTADALRQRARQAYESALAANSDDRRSRDGLAQLDKSQSP